MTELPVCGAAAPDARRGATLAFLTVGVGLVVLLVLLPFSGVVPAGAALALYAVVGVWALDRVGALHPHGRFGLGNWVTLLRLAGAATFAALAVQPGLLSGAAGWAAVVAAGALLATDGLDGWAARRQDLASAFGARFDMETDTVLTLALAALVCGLGKVGAWVLALGLMRYAFVVAGQVWPPLRADLPPSRRRKAVCVLQVGTLGVLLAPPVGAPVAAALAGIALAALAWSFAVDVRWLLRQG